MLKKLMKKKEEERKKKGVPLMIPVSEEREKENGAMIPLMKKCCSLPDGNGKPGQSVPLMVHESMNAEEKAGEEENVKNDDRKIHPVSAQENGSGKERGKGDTTEEALREMLEKQVETDEGWGNFDLELRLRIRKIEDTANGDECVILYGFTITLRDSGETFYREIPAKDAEKVSWIIEKTGGAARFSRNPEARTAVAQVIHDLIVMYTGADEYRYVRNGWKKTRKGWRYLIDSGFIGFPHFLAKGDVSQKFSYKANASGKKETFWRAMQMNMITPQSNIAGFLFLFTHLSMLAALFEEANAPIKFITAVIGPTNSRKTSMALCVCKVFNRDQIHTPDLSFESTMGGIEVMCSKCQDTPVIIDDFHPAMTRRKQNELNEKLEFVLRRYGDRVAKSRMTDFSPNRKAGYYPVRGGCIITGEDITGVESSLARTIVLRVEKQTVDNRCLEFYQEHPLILTSHLYDFLEYVAQKQDQIIPLIEGKFRFMRKQHHYYYPRYSEVFAQIGITAEIVAEYAVARGFSTPEEMKKWIRGIEISVEDIIQQNVLENFASNEVVTILLALQEVGVNQAIDVAEAERTRQNAIYVDAKYYYVRAQTLQEIVVKYCARLGIQSPELNSKRLVNMLEDKGVLYTHKGKNTTRKTHMLPGKSVDKRRYIFIRRQEMEKQIENSEL